MIETRKSDTWLRLQLSTLGSTAAGAVAGVSPYQTPAQLYDAMKAIGEGHLPVTATNDDMRRGLLTEPLHRQILEEELGYKVHEHDQDEFMVSTLYPWAHALPDGWIFDLKESEHSLEEIPVQLKCPRPAAWHKIKLNGIHGHWLIGSQHTLAVTGATHEIFSVLNVETMRLIHMPVYRDEDLIKHLMALENEFMSKLELGERPSDADKPMEIPIPPVGGEMVRIETDEARAMAEAYESARVVRNEAEQLMEEAKGKIRQLMGPARIVQLPQLRCYSQLQPGRLTYDHPAMQRDGIDLKKYEKQGKPFSLFQAFTIDGDSR